MRYVTDAQARFAEIQRFRQPWLVAIIVILSGIFWWGFITQIVLGQPWGTKPAPDWLMWLLLGLVGIGLPAMFLLGSMQTTVDEDALSIRYFRFIRRSIPLREIVSASSVSYHPILEYGGWGVRWGLKGWCYNVSGHHGVMVKTADGKQVMIGSQRADELAMAIGTSSSPTGQAATIRA
jgi:hypothetical protein